MASVVKVAILSDTHGVLDPRIADVVRHCDYAVHAGDLGCAGVAEQMQPRLAKPFIVRGNNDVAAKWPMAETGYLESLPFEVAVTLPGGTLQVVHGDKAGSVAGRHDWLRARYPHARAIVYGHSHRLIVDKACRPWVLNPGAAGRARTYGGPSCIVLTAGSRGWRLKVVHHPSERRPTR